MLLLCVAATALSLSAWLLYRTKAGKHCRSKAERVNLPPEAQDHVLPDFSTISNSTELFKATQDVCCSKSSWEMVRNVIVRDSGSLISVVPAAIQNMEMLEHLDLSGNCLAALPGFIGRLFKLKVLNVARNQLSNLPQEIGQLASLLHLDASDNYIIELPDQLCQLQLLEVLNLKGNRLSYLPDQFGRLCSLRLLGLKSNRLQALPMSFTCLQRLVELFITDNRLTGLPAGFSNLTSLVKMQASFNQFTELPLDLMLLPKLELLRLAVCKIAPLPDGAFSGPVWPCLAWFSLGGNPAAAPVKRQTAVEAASWGDVNLGSRLGDGASGEVKTGTFQNRAVAVKVFTSDVSPDGRTDEEVAIACSINHPHLTKVHAVIEHPPGLIMEILTGKPLAFKPTSKHLLRCRWPDGFECSAKQALKVAKGLASALEYLHAHNICHGDVYAHNLLVDEDWYATLCDFGASFCYMPEQTFWQAMEVRAFGLLLNDLMQQIKADDLGESSTVKQQLATLVHKCTQGDPADRPNFTALLGSLLAAEAVL